MKPPVPGTRVWREMSPGGRRALIEFYMSLFAAVACLVLAIALLLSLAFRLVHAAEVTLTFSAPGDDGPVGTATTYDLRISTTPITPANFIAASRWPMPAPRYSGSAETVTITGLVPGTTYHFAVLACDEVPNCAGLSNLVQVTTPDSTTAPPLPVPMAPLLIQP